MRNLSIIKVTSGWQALWDSTGCPIKSPLQQNSNKYYHFPVIMIEDLVREGEGSLQEVSPRSMTILETDICNVTWFSFNQPWSTDSVLKICCV